MTIGVVKIQLCPFYESCPLSLDPGYCAQPWLCEYFSQAARLKLIKTSPIKRKLEEAVRV